MRQLLLEISLRRCLYCFKKYALFSGPSGIQKSTTCHQDGTQGEEGLCLLTAGGTAGEGLLQAALAKTPNPIREAGGVEEVWHRAVGPEVLLLQARAGHCIRDLRAGPARAGKLGAGAHAADDVWGGACAAVIHLSSMENKESHEKEDGAIRGMKARCMLPCQSSQARAANLELYNWNRTSRLREFVFQLDLTAMPTR